ncbi:MAG: NADH-quinone oxidoreductase subunit L [Chloroflexi bacterium]|nr:NADH-quinone oxidoreductase subunit L [Chloroflexota bacterium]
MPEGVVWAILLLPFGSFAVISLAALLGLTRAGTWEARLSGYLTMAAIAASFLLSLWALDSVLQEDGARIGFDAHEWVTVGSLRVDIGVTVDGLTAIMLIVVTSVSLLVQFYSQGYMRGDPGYNRYYAFMSLFTGSMLGLVLASNILQLFVFWELVGLCSYLLIGFWFYRDSARRAATKAFIVTRIGDLGFLSAILLIWTQTDQLDIGQIQNLAATGMIGTGVITWFALGLFAGAAGKSAQFPLHVWLPDAMEGPTPVSALIHAATMVVAGVYLVARFFPVFIVSEEAINAVVVVGAITAIMAAALAIVATDIKRVMAYSTISQLGYMMMALGVGAIGAAIFHLFTHAFFKALLFLGAGSVNHATGTFDMRKMGGLARFMPVTFLTTTVAGLALVGVFPLAGFWSKDEILIEAWAEKPLIFWTALAGVFLTAVYVGRMLFLTFGGEYKGGEAPSTSSGQASAHGAQADDRPAEPHESPWVMLLPLVVLATLAATVGFVNIRGGMNDILEGWLPEETHELVAAGDFVLWISVVSVAVGLAGLGLAWAIYSRKVIRAEGVSRTLAPLQTLLDRKYYLDDLYETVIVKGLIMRGAAAALHAWDRYVIDGVVNGLASLMRLSSEKLRLAQTGQAQLYGAAIFIGVVALIAGVLIANP